MVNVNKLLLLCIIGTVCTDAFPDFPSIESGREEAFECELVVVARDFYSKSSEYLYQCLDATSGDELDLDVSGVHGFHAATGDQISIKGQRIGRKIMTKWFERKRKSRGARRQLPHTGVRSAAVLMFRFVDSTGQIHPSTMDDDDKRKMVANTVNYTLFGVYDIAVHASHAGAWKECSYGKLELDFDVDGVTNHFGNDVSTGSGAGVPTGDQSDIFYVDVPMVCDPTTDSYCTRYYDNAYCGSNEYYGWPEYAFRKLAAELPGFNKNLWQHWVLILPTGTGIGCDFVGMGTVGCTPDYCYSWIPTGYSHVVQDYTHEMGHNLELSHAGLFGIEGIYGEYGDMSCAMGFCCTNRCFNSPHAWELGWINPSLELDSSNLANHQHITADLKSMSVSDEGTIVITADWAEGDVYWLQLKTAHTYDKFLDTDWLNNVQIKHWNKGEYEGTHHLATLYPGWSWTDPTGTLGIWVHSIDTTTTMTSIVEIARMEGPPSKNTTVAPSTTSTTETGATSSTTITDTTSLVATTEAKIETSTPAPCLPAVRSVVAVPTTTDGMVFRPFSTPRWSGTFELLYTARRLADNYYVSILEFDALPPASHIVSATLSLYKEMDISDPATCPTFSYSLRAGSGVLSEATISSWAWFSPHVESSFTMPSLGAVEWNVTDLVHRSLLEHPSKFSLLFSANEQGCLSGWTSEQGSIAENRPKLTLQVAECPAGHTRSENDCCVPGPAAARGSEQQIHQAAAVEAFISRALASEDPSRMLFSLKQRPSKGHSSTA
mmetsp:Transcript_25905/g.52789  ORF Transcript_25905/g.52789 Transcript_25905/m.52789 type:complete len:775 (-) Transcript_25905:189-2513(-)